MITREYRNTRFLLVDSQLESRLLLERRLKALGAWYIDSAVDGGQAVERCKNGLFDVVICEYHLEGRNGQHVLEELRERQYLRYTSIFIMVSAETTKEMVLAAIDHQPDAYVTKPIAEDTLQQRLDALLIDNEVLYEIRHAMDMKRYSEAINRCEEKISKGSKYTRWCEKTVADLYFRTGDHGEARRVYQRVLDEKPLVWAQVGLARVLLAQGDVKRAEALLQQVLQAAPNCLVAHDLLAELLLEEGRAAEAQSVLAEAVGKSPAAIRRHARLGEIAWANGAIDVATEAYRNAVELGQHSVYNRAENHVGLARALCEKSAAMPKEIRAHHAREALAVLERAATRLPLEDKVAFQRSVIDAKLYRHLQDEVGETACLQTAESLYQRIGLEVDADHALEMAEALLNAGRDVQAEFVMTQVALTHAGDARLQQRMQQIREEPVSAGARQRAAELNRDGIQRVERGQLAEAIAVFSEALEFSPRHPALNLNLVQVLLRAYESGQGDRQSLELAQQCLQRLRNLPASHRQYARYQHLDRKLAALL